MKKKILWKGFVRAMIPFICAIVLFSSFFQSCQKEEVIEPENGALKSTVLPEINLVYPEADVVAGEDFDITYSSSCGKIMLERGYMMVYDEVNLTSDKVYAGLTCETENLEWESVGENVFKTCAGEIVTENIVDPGTYVYRAKLNMKAVKNSGCDDCATIPGNQFECFMITVTECTQNTFTDGRDDHVYKIVTIGNQTWMAENLAYNGTDSEGNVIAGIYAYNDDETNVATYGRLYTWDAAMAACPAGWHLPSNAEWTELKNYLISNVYGCEDDTWIGKALALPGWEFSINPGAPGYPLCDYNTSGFGALPAGYRTSSEVFTGLGMYTRWWSSDRDPNIVEFPYFYYMSSQGQTIFQGQQNYLSGFSVRCVKD